MIPFQGSGLQPDGESRPGLLKRKPGLAAFVGRFLFPRGQPSLPRRGFRSPSPGQRPGGSGKTNHLISSAQRANHSVELLGRWPARTIWYPPESPGRCPGLGEWLGLRPAYGPALSSNLGRRTKIECLRSSVSASAAQTRSDRKRPIRWAASVGPWGPGGRSGRIAEFVVSGRPRGTTPYQTIPHRWGSDNQFPFQAGIEHSHATNHRSGPSVARRPGPVGVGRQHRVRSPHRPEGRRPAQGAGRSSTGRSAAAA